ncbi:MAG: CopG family transcriptional regulator [Gemmatimonadaceae bacterium]
MAKIVREPIQVYLSADERAELDGAARDMGVSRSEVLRRGIGLAGGVAYAGPLRDLVEGGYLTPATTGPGAPPPSAPVASLRKILAELTADRGET